MKKILIATDAFKNALPAIDVCKAIEKGIKKIDQNIITTLCPLADGGEGSLEVLARHLDAEWKSVQVKDPLLRTIESQYLSIDQGKIAFIEMAAASGIELLDASERSALKTSTFGTGELIQKAIRNGAKKIFITIGGSATHDVGTGMAEALGFQFFDKNGNLITPNGQSLNRISKVVFPEHLAALRKVTFTILCDVNNPLLGESGAAKVFAPQKGASHEEVDFLEEATRHFSKIAQQHFPQVDPDRPGSGAAGGLGFGGQIFLNAQLQSGAKTIFQLIHLAEMVSSADLVISGEGKLDDQTGGGKLVASLAELCLKQSVPLIALVGQLSASDDLISQIGLSAAFSISNGPQSLEQAIQGTAKNLTDTTCQIIRLLQLQNRS